MILLGLDFDNTIVNYDKLFYSLAVSKGLIPSNIAAEKTAVREYLKNKGKEEDFTIIQGEVYGSQILGAEPAERVLEILYRLSKQGISMALVSHKTRKPYKGPEYDLHKAAWTWLEKHNFFNEKGTNWEKKQVYFEETKEAKIKRIKDLGCTHYIDDLPNILTMIPKEIKKILYDPKNVHANEKFSKLERWQDLPRLLK